MLELPEMGRERRIELLDDMVTGRLKASGSIGITIVYIWSIDSFRTY